MSQGTSNRQDKGPDLRAISIIFVALALAAAAALFICDTRVQAGYSRMQQASERYIAANLAARDMEAGSDYLTDRARCFVMTGQLSYAEDFFHETGVTRRRDLSLERLEKLLDGSDSGAYVQLAAALELSNALLGREHQALRLMQLSCGYTDDAVPAALAAIPLTDEDQALSPAEQTEKARSLLFDDTYTDFKQRIRSSISLCTEALISDTQGDLSLASQRLDRLLTLQTILTIVLLLDVLGLVIFISSQVRTPLTRMIRQIRDKQMISPVGAEELRFVARTYNEVYEENQKAHQNLSYEVMHDALTGLYNRRAYDLFMQSMDLSHVALLVIDVYKFKTINDTYGHDGGDKVLRRVGRELQRNFRSVDMVCRIGGDEFAVIMTRMNSSMGALVAEKIARINQVLPTPADDSTPPSYISVGVAFSDRPDPGDDLFKDADKTLYEVKNSIGYGCRIYGETEKTA